MTEEERSISESLLSTITERIKAYYEPLKIILFGSQARGEAGHRSDIDLLIIKDSDEPRYKRSAPIYTLLASLPIEIDIIVYTPDEIKEWSNVRQAFITTAIREGRVLYEKQT